MTGRGKVPWGRQDPDPTSGRGPDPGYLGPGDSRALTSGKVAGPSHPVAICIKVKGVVPSQPPPSPASKERGSRDLPREREGSRKFVGRVCDFVVRHLVQSSPRTQGVWNKLCQDGDGTGERDEQGSDGRHRTAHR